MKKKREGENRRKYTSSSVRIFSNATVRVSEAQNIHFTVLVPMVVTAGLLAVGSVGLGTLDRSSVAQ